MKLQNLFFAALAGVAFAGCSSDDFTGDISPTIAQDGPQAINFNGGSQQITRSESGDITKLDGQFVVYGVKSGATAGTGLQTVFDHYALWNKTDGASNNTTNKYGWEYVGTKWTQAGDPTYGVANIKLSKDQTIKYWDLSAADYRFVAGSPVSSFTFTVDANKNITGATVTGIDAHIRSNPVTDADGNAITGTSGLNHGAVYVAKPLILDPDVFYNQAVTFEFTGQQSLVRVGVYETIPGYHVTAINFYSYNGSVWASSPSEYHNIILNAFGDGGANYFTGGNGMQATLTYNWTGTPSYSFSYGNVDGNVKSRNWYGGSFYNGVPCTSSHATVLANLYGTDKDMANTGYFPVMPTATGVTPTPLVIKCDYTLTSDDGSGETIEVEGATAAIPAAFAQWEVNHAYTYLFKISDKTAGAAGVLYPIQFDAAVIDGANNRDGFITTISIPSITSYQFASPNTDYNSDGSFKETYIKYKKNTPIYVTVQDNDDGDLRSLSALTYATPANGNIQVYYLGTTALTESDLQINRPVVGSATTTSIPASAWSLHGKEVAAGKYMTFTATTIGYYAVEYVQDASTTPVTYAYKVIHIEE